MTSNLYIEDQVTTSLTPYSGSDIRNLMKGVRAIEKQRDVILANKDQAETLVNASDLISGTLADTNTVISGVHPLLLNLTDLLACIPALKLIGTILVILYNLFKMVTGLTIKLNSKYTGSNRGIGSFDIAAAGVGLAFCITAIAITILAPYMIFVTFAGDALLNIWKLGHGIYKQRTIIKTLREELKDKKKEFYEGLVALSVKERNTVLNLLRQNLTDHHAPAELAVIEPHLLRLVNLDREITKRVNEIRVKNGELGKNIGDCMKSVASHVAAITFLFCQPVGCILLVATGLYSIADRYGYNPFKWLGNLIFNKPFDPVARHNSVDNIEKIVCKLQNQKTPDQIEISVPKTTYGKSKILDNQNTIEKRVSFYEPTTTKRVVYNDQKILGKDSPILARRHSSPTLYQQPNAQRYTRS